MADTPVSWDTIAHGADDHQLTRTIVAFSENTGADVSVTLRREGSNRTITISTAVYEPDEEPAEP